MENDDPDEKSCGPQPLSNQQPSHAWGVGQLGKYAREQHRLIIAAEKKIAPAYWRLGQALSLARKQFGRGHWAKYLAQWKIDKSRASKARAIFFTFTTEKVEGKSVEEAYNERERRPAASRRSSPPSLKNQNDSLMQVLNRLVQRAEQMAAEAASADPDRAGSPLAAVTEAIERLQVLQEQLQLRAEANNPRHEMRERQKATTRSRKGGATSTNSPQA